MHVSRDRGDALPSAADYACTTVTEVAPTADNRPMSTIASYDNVCVITHDSLGYFQGLIDAKKEILHLSL